jgi:hypothetical protein
MYAFSSFAAWRSSLAFCAFACSIEPGAAKDASSYETPKGLQVSQARAQAVGTPAQQKAADAQVRKAALAAIHSGKLSKDAIIAAWGGCRVHEPAGDGLVGRTDEASACGREGFRPGCRTHESGGTDKGNGERRGEDQDCRTGNQTLAERAHRQPDAGFAAFAPRVGGDHPDLYHPDLSAPVERRSFGRARLARPSVAFRDRRFRVTMRPRSSQRTITGVMSSWLKSPAERGPLPRPLPAGSFTPARRELHRTSVHRRFRRRHGIRSPA